MVSQLNVVSLFSTAPLLFLKVNKSLPDYSVTVNVQGFEYIRNRNEIKQAVEVPPVSPKFSQPRELDDATFAKN